MGRVLYHWSRRQLEERGVGAAQERCTCVFFSPPIVKQPSGRKVATTNVTNQAFRVKVEAETGG